MPMLRTLNVAEARAKFREVMTSAVHDHRPLAIARGSAVSEAIVVLGLDDLARFLSAYRFPVTLEQGDGAVVASLADLELWGSGYTRQAAIRDLRDDLIQYAQDYFERASLFLQAPNRAHHAPWLLRVLLCESPEEVERLLEIPAHA